jgi:two-component system LytT family response regulator
MIKTVIIDDEIAFINTLEIMLKHRSEFQIVGHARSVKEGLALINRVDPDLIFLDVKLGDGKGFDILRKLKGHKGNVIFVTAYDHYAVEAFRFSAIDYLLKPIDSEELYNALEKVKNNLANNQLQLKFNTLLENIGQTEKKKIILKEIDVHHVVGVDQVLWCSAEGSYTRVFMKTGKYVIVSKNLKEFETLLLPYHFFRIHRSHLVNVNKIKRFEKSEGGMVHLEGGHQLPVSFRKKDKLSQILAGM